MSISVKDHLEVQEAVQCCLEKVMGSKVAAYFKITIEFRTDLGTDAGRALLSNGRSYIYLNEELFLRNKSAFFKDIIKHEVAHIIQFVMYPEERLHHGKKWKEIMLTLGAVPNRLHSFDLSDIKGLHRYSCACELENGWHFIKDAKHKKIQQGLAVTCSTCSSRIIYFPKGD